MVYHSMIVRKVDAQLVGFITESQGIACSRDNLHYGSTCASLLIESAKDIHTHIYQLNVYLPPCQLIPVTFSFSPCNLDQLSFISLQRETSSNDRFPLDDTIIRKSTS